MHNRQKIFKFTDMQLLHFFSRQNSATSDISRAFRPITITKLSTLNSSTVFMAHPVLYWKPEINMVGSTYGLGWIGSDFLCQKLTQETTKCSLGRQTIPPVPPCGELHETQAMSLNLTYSLYENMASSTKPKYITYCIAVKEGPSNGHR